MLSESQMEMANGIMERAKECGIYEEPTQAFAEDFLKLTLIVLTTIPIDAKGFDDLIAGLNKHIDAYEAFMNERSDEACSN